MQQSARAAAVELFQMELGRQMAINNDGQVTLSELLQDRDAVRQAAEEALSRIADPGELVVDLVEYAAWLYSWSLTSLGVDPIAKSLKLGSTYLEED